MADPLNTPKELVTFTSFSEGDSRATDAPIFKKSQIELALQMARDEIYDRTLGKENDAFDTRLGVTRHAELYLATSRLYDMWGERLGLLSVDANLVNVGAVGLGADTPPPLGQGSKMEFFVKYMSNIYHAKGIMLLIGRPFEMGLGADMTGDIRFPCLSQRTYSDPQWVCCG